MLLTLCSHFSTQHSKAAVRVYWPKGRVAIGASSSDNRVPASNKFYRHTDSRDRSELLMRFSEKQTFDDCILDESLKSVMVPFNERTASRAVICLTRGSRIPIPSGKLVRLFLHWCQPEQNGHSSDLDLSVGFYDRVLETRGSLLILPAQV